MEKKNIFFCNLIKYERKNFVKKHSKRRSKRNVEFSEIVDTENESCRRVFVVTITVFIAREDDD